MLLAWYNLESDVGTGFGLHRDIAERTKITVLSEILTVLNNYRGAGALLILYGAALVYLLICEKDRTIRAIFVYMPLTILILFLLPPVYKIYSRFETETYYRMLWLIPMSITIVYAGLRISVMKLKKFWPVGAAVLAAAIILGGNYVYDNQNILKAENSQHLPHQVIDVSEFLLNDSGDIQLKAAMPADLVQFVRQYTSKIDMPYGREMVVSQWDYWNPVYEAMEKTDTVDVGTLVEATRDAKCNYIVLNASKAIEGDFSDYGIEDIGNVDGYEVYKDPEVPVIDYSVYYEE